MIDHAEFWDSATRRQDRPRPLESARCSLCGIELPKGLMMPDGGGACADVRWYCKDTRSCTERWTAQADAVSASGDGAEQREPEEAAERVPADAAERPPADAGAREPDEAAERPPAEAAARAPADAAAREPDEAAAHAPAEAAVRAPAESEPSATSGGA